MRTSNYYDFQALNQPQADVWKNRRKEHNCVKNLLLNYALKRVHCSRIVDLACGKGGDINKYKCCCPNATITCVDKSKNSLEVLKTRFQEDSHLIESVIHGDAADVDLGVRKFDIAVVNFALHYFCGTEEHLTKLLAQVSSSLSVGGMFIGTCLDYRMLHSANHCITADPHILEGIQENSWGRSYRYCLPGCVDADEYVVYFPKIISIAHQMKMHLVKSQSFNGFLYANNVDPQTPKDNMPYKIFVFVKSDERV